MTIIKNKDIFQLHRIRNTKQRNALLDILKETETPMTAEEIFLKMKEIDKGISLSTIYRILDLFISFDIVIKSNPSEENKAIFELNKMEHKHHLFCLSCKKIVPVMDCPLDKFEKLVQDETGYEITGHKLEIYGYCPKCKK